MSSKTPLDIVYGCMTFGREGEEQVRTSDLADCAAILDTFQSHGHNEVDTSRFYGDGTSEEYLAQLSWQKRGLLMDTKFFPNVHGLFGRTPTHSRKEDMGKSLEESLTALGAEGVDLWYLHAPDRSVPLEETARAVHELFQEGSGNGREGKRFKRWGVSNFMAWEVAAICEICKANRYQLPSVYQGVYNALHRSIEHELLPCLRKYNMSFYAFNPLAGGWLTSRYKRDTQNEALEAGSRFDANRMQGKMYRARYWNDEFFTAIESLRSELPEGQTESETALRWMMHHSQLEEEFGDKVIIGASSKGQLEMNLRDFEKGPLDEGVVKVLDEGWAVTRGVGWKYFH